MGAAPNARQRLPPVIAAYFAEGREVLANEPTPSELHGLRLATKRLRYTLELFRSCYGPSFRTRITALRRLQQVLGELNDCATAATLVAEASGAPSPQRTRIQSFLRERTLAKTEEFRREWTQIFDAPGQEQWWIDYFARHARAPGRKP